MQNVRNKYRFAGHVIAAAILICLLLWLIHHRRQFSVDSGARRVMGTLARVVVVVQDRNQAAAAIQKAFDEIENVQILMNDRDPNSQLSEVNRRAFFEPVAVDDAVFEVLAASIEYSRLSDGAFDVTVGPVVLLWRQSATTGEPPAAEALAEARASVGWQSLLLDAEHKTVRFGKEGMRLDLGGIAKGYAVDRAIQAMRDLGVPGGMVDIGGNIRCFGQPAHYARHWQIGLQDPRHEQALLMTLVMDERAVATSGDYRRFAVVDGQRFSHIINPRTASSSQTLSSVTIIAPTAMQADALSTAVTVLEEQKGLALLDSIPETEAVLVKSSGELLKSRNADRFILTSDNNK